MNERPLRRAVLARLGAASIALGALGTACSSSGPRSGLSPPDLFTWAQERFDEGDYGSAVRGFQDFLIQDPLNPLTDSAQFMIAEATLRDGREVEAAEEFSRLATGRPGSPWADDAQFGTCRAYWEASPDIPLTQEYTRRAVEECERLLQFFPASPLAGNARAVIDEARGKLARKSYDIGRYYYDREFYESANVYFEKALSQSPSAELLPELLERLYRSYTAVGFASEARLVRERLLEEFPDSEQARALRDDDGRAS
ncbi:MAG: outer membrane protein assembly factor BamD [Gemmatimonadota bacterium]